MLLQPTVPATPDHVATGHIPVPSPVAPARAAARVITRQPPIAPLLGQLSNGQLAVAIHAAGIPTNADALSIGEIEALAVTGLCQLGLAEAGRINDESRAANISYCAKTRCDRSAEVHAELAIINRIWGSRKREQQAVDLAYRLLCDLTCDKAPMPTPRD